MKKILAIAMLLVGTAFAQRSSTGSITTSGATCAVTNACVSLQFQTEQTGAATIQVTGTWTATLQFEASLDNGVTWAAINATPPNSSTGASSTAANGSWQVNVAAFTNIRVRCSAFTSGTAVVLVNSSNAMAKSGGGGGGSFTGGTITSPILAADGTAVAPSYSFTNSTTSGMTQTLNQIGIVASNGGQGWWQINPNVGGVSTGSTTAIGWNSGTTIFSGSIDTFLKRNAAGVVGLGATTSNWLIGTNISANTGKGQHINTQAAANDLAGTFAVSASTTGSVTFTTNYGSAPVCVLTPQTTGITSWFISSISVSGFTVTVAPSGTYTFGYICMGNPN